MTRPTSGRVFVSGREKSRLPERFLTTALADDPQAVLTRERLSALISAYNIERGWTHDGHIP